MRIVKVDIHRYRCIEHLSLALPEFAAFVGSNGSGKSAVLHALDWFFNGGTVDEFDYHISDDGTSVDDFSVAVTFADLPTHLAARWSKYVRAGVLDLRRTRSRSGHDQLSGLLRQGPGFREIRDEQDFRVRRTLYAATREKFPELEAAQSKDKIFAALAAWEEDPVNGSKLVDIDDADLNNAFGFYGKQLLSTEVRFVLVRASTRLEDNVDPSGRGGAIDSLLGAVVRAAAEQRAQEWARENAGLIEELAREMKTAVGASSAAQMSATNGYLEQVIAGARISIEATAEPPKIRPEIGLKATFEYRGSALPISRQGHGVQRSVMMAALQAAADLSDFDDIHSILAIEEPELYQHPARSGALSRALGRLVETGAWQVLIATHSPAFIRPDSVASVRRFQIVAGNVQVAEGSAAGYAARAGISEVDVRRHLEKLLPNDFSNAVFADRVLLVEGASDKIVLSRVLELLGQDVDSHNWAIVNCEGKTNISVAAAVLMELEIDVRILFDGDKNSDAKDVAHKVETDKLLSSLSRLGLFTDSEVYSFGDPTIRFSRVAILRSDIEAEEALWPSFMAALATHTGTATPTKNAYHLRLASVEATLDDCPPGLLGVASVIS